MLDVLNGGLETEFVGVRERVAKNRGIVFVAGSNREDSSGYFERIRHFKPRLLPETFRANGVMEGWQ